MDKRLFTVLALAILLPMALRGQDFKIGEGKEFRQAVLFRRDKKGKVSRSEKADISVTKEWMSWRSTTSILKAIKEESA